MICLWFKKTPPSVKRGLSNSLIEYLIIYYYSFGYEARTLIAMFDGETAPPLFFDI